MEGLKMKYFVLNPRSKKAFDMYAMAARASMLAYSNCITEENPQLANELAKWAMDEQRKENENYGRITDGKRDQG